MHDILVYVWAKDQDNALEILGSGADTEYNTLESAKKGYDEDYHDDKKIFKVTVEQVKNG